MIEEAKTSLTAAATTQTTRLSVQSWSGDGAGVQYANIVGCLPATNQNCIATWQGGPQVLWNSPANNTSNVTTDTQDGGMFIPQTLTPQPHVLGYAVGPLLSAPAQINGNICATSYMPNMDPSQQQEFNSSLSSVSVSANFVQFNFEIPTGCTPKTNSAWCAMWRLDAPSYTAEPLYKFQVYTDNSSGTLAFNNAMLAADTVYTIGFFMSGWVEGGDCNQKPMACSITFRTPSEMPK